MKIRELYAKEILDSRGNPTIKIYITLENGFSANAEVPSGASVGTFEAHELRDNDSARFNGKGVLKACRNVSNIFEAIKHLDVEQQRDIDLAMIQLDGTDAKERLGANAMLGVSIACVKASALHKGMSIHGYINSYMNNFYKKSISESLPTPLFNILNGGQHADNGIDFQEFMLIPYMYDQIEQEYAPQKTAGNTPDMIRAKIRMGAEVLHSLKKILKDSKLDTGLGDEGGYAPRLPDAKSALNLLCEAVIASGYTLYDQACLGIDCASDYFYDAQTHEYLLNSRTNDPHPVSYNYLGMKNFYSFFLDNYPLVYLEDYFSEESFDEFARFITEPHKRRIAFCGDDLIVTNSKRLQKAIDMQAITSMIVKPNQIGTISETLDVINMCIDNNIIYVPSHRSGETNDSFIADLAVGSGAKFLKAGAPQRGERVAKYNRLIEIANEFEMKPNV